MARIARAVAPGIPHHVIQRGNRRQQTFFNDEDYLTYLQLMSEWCNKYQVEIWAYCLMPNHIHLIAVPETKDGLKLGIGEAHRRYTRRINFRKGWPRPFMAGKIFFFYYGRKVSFVMYKIYRIKSCTCKFSKEC